MPQGSAPPANLTERFTPQNETSLPNGLPSYAETTIVVPVSAVLPDLQVGQEVSGQLWAQYTISDEPGQFYYKELATVNIRAG